MYQLSKAVGFFILLFLMGSVSASSISDCIYKVKVTKVSKRQVSFKVVSLMKSLGTDKCIYKNGQSADLKLKKIKKTGVNLVPGKDFSLRAMKYQGKGHKGILVTGERYYFGKI